MVSRIIVFITWSKPLEKSLFNCLCFWTDLDWPLAFRREDESLLFSSGKTAVEPKGIEALKNVAKVLEQNADINILVEGHTDDVPMAGKGEIKDNWDLSVIRATSVTKIILQNSKTDPKRITSAGRGEFFPLDPAKTPEARKKNRRTELILTPKLDELLKVLGSN